MKILLVEDEHKIAHAIKQGLEQEKYIVDVANDGVAGFDMATDDGYDLLIVDRLLPGIAGLDICKKIREQGKQLPILILTAKGQLADKVEGLNSGVDDYMVKPFAFEELLSRVRALLRRPHQMVQTTLSVDSLSLDTSSFEVKRNGKIVILSAREFSLLEYMMRHAKKILTKEQIINHVWNYDANILSNTVEVFIGYLRNKIDKPFPKEKKLIQTVRGFGYRLG